MVVSEKIPVEMLPSCWSDDVRMNALFAPFRLKSANPESWNMKMKFWSDMIRQWCHSREDPHVTAAEVKAAFQRKGRTPACLEIVIEEMFRCGELAPSLKYQQVLQSKAEGWVRWGARLAFKPAALALTVVSYMLPARHAVDNDGLPKASIDVNQRFILESCVKKQSAELLEKYPLDLERVGVVEQMMQRCKLSSRETFDTLLGYLVSTGSAVVDGDIIKLGEGNKRCAAVSEAERALARLSAAEERQAAATARLLADVGQATSAAAAAAKAGDRHTAKQHLRRRRELKARAERTAAAQRRTAQLLQQARDLGEAALVLDTYKTSAAALRRATSDSGLSRDAVDDVMDDLRDVMESFGEVEEALAGPRSDADLGDLERELEDLLQEPPPRASLHKPTLTNDKASPQAAAESAPERRAPRASPSTASPPPATTAPPPATPAPPSLETPSFPPDSEFVFDGEERMIEELKKLTVHDRSLEGERRKVAAPEQDGRKRGDEAWPQWAQWQAEVRFDDRLHPGQQVSVDCTGAPALYGSESPAGAGAAPHTSGVWLYTEHAYRSPEKIAAPAFHKTPGSERPTGSSAAASSPDQHATHDLEKRLRALRGLNF